jgi:hypothetical protein
MDRCAVPVIANSRLFKKKQIFGKICTFFKKLPHFISEPNKVPIAEEKCNGCLSLERKDLQSDVV